ncbi:MAG: glutaredoxin, partial [Rudaea sp.]
MFALEWCEFCWAVRKLFARCDVAYRSVDLDSAAYQVEDLGGRLRGALRERTGSRTIPQIFVAGRFIGGATEVFDALEGGELQRELAAAGVAFD